MSDLDRSQDLTTDRAAVGFVPLMPEALRAAAALEPLVEESRKAHAELAGAWKTAAGEYQARLGDLTVTPLAAARAAGKVAAEAHDRAAVKVGAVQRRLRAELEALDAATRIDHRAHDLGPEIRQRFANLPDDLARFALLRDLLAHDPPAAAAVLGASPVVSGFAPAAGERLREIAEAARVQLFPEAERRRRILQAASDDLTRAALLLSARLGELLPPAVAEANTDDEGAAAKAEEWRRAELGRRRAARRRSQPAAGLTW